MTSYFETKPKLLISACLLGQPVRYDGKSKPIHSEIHQMWFEQLKSEGRLFILCPEVAGGLPTPRPAAEFQSGSQQVLTQSGVDVTAEFQSGANKALALCQQHEIEYALLKANSPSCGNRHIYDGSFSGTLISGMGLTAKLLSENEVKVFSELEVDQLMAIFGEQLV